MGIQGVRRESREYDGNPGSTMKIPGVRKVHVWDRLKISIFHRYKNSISFVLSAKSLFVKKTI